MTTLLEISNIYERATQLQQQISETSDSERVNKLLKKQRKLIRKIKILRDALCLSSH
jgi:hypothetical protein